ncbi:uncharacterized protein YrrD [Anaerobacterium chartisolvens]|uniref:Uncharacterized protein YrrD n=1 Tax=Anaerobacterium chartisolvens TaxID=1297424 RepID=A0A369AWL8_9FIRM|nr:PRC-barrel domain-containing protein [Anaerobacterium chartisolvens]RCX13790.1 uncharacterized protein YrrD [Anaerobacterium chartisolvens]
MERYSEVVGLPVISADTGKKLGLVKDVIFCPKKKEIKGFMLERKGCEIYKRIIFLKDVLNVGRDALIIENGASIRKMHRSENNEELKEKGEIRGLKVYSKRGSDLGVVKDIVFDCKTGVVEGLEISDGLLQDIMKGRSLLPLFGKVEFSEENIIVEKEAVEEMTQTGGGLRRFFKIKAEGSDYIEKRLYKGSCNRKPDRSIGQYAYE